MRCTRSPYNDPPRQSPSFSGEVPKKRIITLESQLHRVAPLLQLMPVLSSVMHAGALEILQHLLPEFTLLGVMRKLLPVSYLTLCKPTSPTLVSKRGQLNIVSKHCQHGNCLLSNFDRSHLKPMLLRFADDLKHLVMLKRNPQLKFYHPCRSVQCHLKVERDSAAFSI